MVLHIVRDPLPLTPNCKHYDEIKSVPRDLQKYFCQRHAIFDAYDYDIRLTDDAWFGVTPEPVARKIAEDIQYTSTCAPAVGAAGSQSQPESLSASGLNSSQNGGEQPHYAVIDLFGGVGGNAIAFALSGIWNTVIAVEKDPDTLACAQHNAAVYELEPGAITWILGDCFELLAAIKRAHGVVVGTQEEGEVVEDSDEIRELLASLDMAHTTLFASPPWGGVSYRDQPVFDLSTMQPYNLTQLHEACRPLGHALFLPRTSDIRQIAALVPSSGSGGEGDAAQEKIDVVQYCMEGASKALVAYMPPCWQEEQERVEEANLRRILVEELGYDGSSPEMNQEIKDLLERWRESEMNRKTSEGVKPSWGKGFRPGKAKRRR